MTKGSHHIQAPAKINLTLFVGPKKSDGFHYVESLFTAISLYDDLEFNVTSQTGVALSMHNALPFEQPEFDRLVSEEGDNLISRAYALAAANSGTVRLPGLSIRITKRIPLGGGLGGGSSNAAALFWFLYTRTEWGQQITFDELATLSLGIGSDVPFFLYYLRAAAEKRNEKAAVLFGRGSELHPLQLSPLHGVLAFPGFGVSTGDAYSSLKRPLQPWPQPESRLDFSNRGPFSAATAEGRREILSSWPLGSRFIEFENEFEPAVFAKHPVLSEIQKAFEDSGAYVSRMSGSGATMFGLADNAERTRNLHQAMKTWSQTGKSGVQFAEFHTL